MLMKHPLARYCAAFLLSVIIAMGLLFLAACLPQGPIDTHVAESADIMV